MMMDVIRGLSLKEKETLFAELCNMIQEEKFSQGNEDVRLAEEIKMEVCDALGVTTYDATSRLRPYVMVRVITANVLLGLGKTEDEVGRMMGKDRTSIYHYKVVAETWRQFPRLYKEELNVLNQTNERHDTDKGTI